MSSDRVSDKRLADLIATYMNIYHQNNEHHAAVANALSELQSRRAAEQAALPAVEEMAFKLADAAYRNSDADPKHFTHIKDEMEHYITPLYANLASQAELLGECGEYLRERKSDHRLDGILARIDALLGAKGGEDVE